MSERARLQPKHQRLALVVAAVVALVAAAIIATWALRSQASYFYVPSEIVKDHPAPGRAVRLGGMVEKGSILTRPDGVTIELTSTIPPNRTARPTAGGSFTIWLGT